MNDFEALQGKRILIVDDEPDVIETLEELLSMAVIETATTFEAAGALMEAKPFDIAVLDIMGVDGFTLLQIAVEKQIIGVMLTAHALSPQAIIRSHDTGAAYYIPKEKMSEIAVYLSDILKAKETGENPWKGWFERMSDFLEKKFGPNWQKNDKSFWDRISFY
ncbi:MAG: response regulator [Thermodesulfobacteriota bacterium]